MQTDFFKNNTLFSPALETSFQQLAHMAHWQCYKKGAMILDHRQSEHTFLYIVRGWIKLFKESADGQEIIVNLLTHDQYCGEEFLSYPSKQETYQAQSISDLDVLTFPIRALRSLIASDPQLAFSFLQSTLQKQQELNERIEHLSIQNAIQRIGCYLLRSCDDPKNPKTSTKLPYHKVLLASFLGMKPETFSRALKEMSKQYGLHVQGDVIHIPDVKKLVGFVCQHCSKVFPCQPSE